MSTFHFEVPPETEKMRADSFCAAVLNGITRSKLKTGLQELRINGKSAKLSAPVHGGDCIDLSWQDPIPASLTPEPIAVPVIFENEDVIIVNKPAGMVTHPAAGHWIGTLVNALEYYRRSVSSIPDEFSRIPSLHTLPNTENGQTGGTNHLRTGIVHRLDKDTSGLIITARNRKAEAFLKNVFKRRQVDKYYLAVLSGIPKEPCGTVITSVFRKNGDRTRFSVSEDLSKGKYARSRYKVLKIYGTYALVLFKIDTGRTHQIRLHARFIGCPVAGDPVYGYNRKKHSDLHRYGLLLHAYKVRIRLPHQQAAEEKSVFTAGIPRRFKAAIKLLKENPNAAR